MYTHEMRVKDVANALADRFFEDALEAAENQLDACYENGWMDMAILYKDVVAYIKVATAE